MLNKFYSALFLLIMVQIMPAKAQVYVSCDCLCGWGYVHTGLNHTIGLTSPIVTLDGVPIAGNGTTQNVYLGVFYDSLGTLSNAGFTSWTGNPNAISAWATETGLTNGFANNELFKWKMCVVDLLSGTSVTYDCDVSYLQSMPNTSNFMINGISNVTSISAESVASVTAPNWNYAITSGNHSILIPASALPQIDGEILASGDYIGVFYDSLGTLSCAGYTQWTGANTAITAWGSDLGNDGLANGEIIKWKVWQLSTGNTITMSATYGTSFPNAGNYATNGISGLASLSGNTITLEEILNPISGCNLGNESISVSVTNPNTDPIHEFTLSYVLDGNSAISETDTNTIAPGAIYTYTFTNQINLSASGNYQLSIFTGTNDSLSTQVFNENNQVELSLGNNSFCQGDLPLAYQLSPSTAWINGTGIQNGLFNPTVAGVGEHWIYYGNPGLYNCPVEDSLLIHVHALPQVSINTVSPLCINDASISLSASPSGGNFSGQGVINNLFNPQAGTSTISYSYTDQNGCTSQISTSIHVDVPLPIEINGLSYTVCLNATPTNFTSNAMASGTGISGQNGNYIFDPSLAIAGTNMIYFDLENGACLSMDTIAILILDTPQVNIGVDALIGANQWHNLDAGAGYSNYSWSNGASNQTISLNSSGHYDVTVSDTYGCEGISNTINLTVGPWGNHLSGINHSILIPVTASMLIGTEPIEAGDFIGVFFDDNGLKSCGGWIRWDGITTGISAWGDDSTTPQKDGFADNEAFEWRIFDWSTGDEYTAFATYSNAFPDGGTYVTNGISGISGLLTSFTQTLSMPAGWSLISTYIDPFNPAVDNIFASNIANLNLMKNGTGQIYWPAYGVNMIQNLVVGQGYQLNAVVPFNQEITGMKLNPTTTPLNLPTGWNLIAYLRSSSMSISSIMNPYVNDIVIIKNDVGQIFWPQYGVNLIGNMLPGKGYQIKLSSPITLYYPAN